MKLAQELYDLSEKAYDRMDATNREETAYWIYRAEAQAYSNALHLVCEALSEMGEATNRNLEEMRSFKFNH